MAEANKDPYKWTADHAQLLRKVLVETPLIHNLRARLVKCSGATTEERAATGSQRQGGEDLLDEIFSLQYDPSKSAGLPRAGFIS